MYPKLALSSDVHRVSFLASKDKLTILVIAIMYMSMTCVKNTISSLGTSFPNTFHRPPCDDTLVSGWVFENQSYTMLVYADWCFHHSLMRSVSQLSNDEG